MLTSIILLAGFLNLLMGIVIWFATRAGRGAKLFAAASFLAFFWSLSVYFIYITQSIWAVRASYALGSFVIASMLAWSLYYLGYGRSFWGFLFIYALATFFAYLSFFTPLIVRNAWPNFFGGMDEENGRLFWLYNTYYLVVFLGIMGHLVYKYFNSKNKSKEQKRIRLMVAGLCLYLLSTGIFSFVLPYFGVQRFIDLDVPSSMFFVGFVMYAMIKHRLMNVQLVSVQVVSMALLGTMLTDVFLNPVAADLKSKFFQLGFLLVLFIFLIRNILLEVRKKDEFRTMAMDLVRANEELRKLDEAKAEFVSLASHQLRTPLTAIKGFLQMLEDGSGGQTLAQQRPVLQRMEAATAHLGELTEELLDLSRADAGTMGKLKQEVFLEKIVQDLLPRYEAMARVKDLQLEVSLPKKKMHPVEADEYRIRFVFGVLIDNALRYSEKGKVKIVLKRTAQGVQFSVEDKGMGLTKEDQKHLFEKFYRGERQKKTYVDGVGIGLYLANYIIRLHKGVIKLSSPRAGAGCKAVVVL